MVQGFCFALLQCSPYKRLQRVLFRSCGYTAHTAKRHTWLYRRFSCDFPYSTARDTRPTQAAIIPPATRWSTSQRRSTSSAYQIPAPRRTLYRSAQPAYYNKVYKGAAYRRPCQPGGVDRWQVLTHCQQYRPGAPAEGSASPPVQGQPGGVSIPPTPGGLRSCTGSARHTPPGGAVQRQSAAGGAEPLAATAASFFGLSPDS